MGLSARALLVELGAPARLLRHVDLVLEAGERLVAGLGPLDAEAVRVGILLHDCGKIEHPAELDGPGDRHEAAGEALLLARGVPADVARICRTHARWEEAETLEELVVALADKLWKGTRVQALEDRVVAWVAGDRWDERVRLDDLFEAIADGGAERLARS